MADTTYQQTASLPDALIAALPASPREQLGVAFSIAARAATAAAAAAARDAEAEARQLRADLAEARAEAERLRAANADLERAARAARDEAHAAASDRQPLVDAVARLTKEVTRLEGLRASLLRQLQDGGGGVANSPGLKAAVGMAAAAAAAGRRGAAAQRSPLRGGGDGDGDDEDDGGDDVAARGTAARDADGSCAGSATPPAAEVVAVAAPADAGPSDRSAEVRFASETASASGGQHADYGRGGDSGGGDDSGRGGGADGRWQQPPEPEAAPGPRSSVPATPAAAFAAASSAAGGGWAAHISTPVLRLAAPTPARVDGREFFRTARARLPPGGFADFLAAIKQLNAGEATRGETLAAARALLGPANKDLYVLFEGLLSRHLPA